MSKGMVHSTLITVGVMPESSGVGSLGAEPMLLSITETSLVLVNHTLRSKSLTTSLSSCYIMLKSNIAVLPRSPLMMCRSRYQLVTEALDTQSGSKGRTGSQLSSALSESTNLQHRVRQKRTMSKACAPFSEQGKGKARAPNGARGLQTTGKQSSRPSRSAPYFCFGYVPNFVGCLPGMCWRRICLDDCA